MALVLDGKTFAEATMVVALGITMTGDKRFLGFVETDTENEQVLTPFLRSLVERGLDVSQGLLVIVDGGKGLRAAVRRPSATAPWCKVGTRPSKREHRTWRPPARLPVDGRSLKLEDRNQSAPQSGGTSGCSVRRWAGR